MARYRFTDATPTPRKEGEGLIADARRTARNGGPRTPPPSGGPVAMTDEDQALWLSVYDQETADQQEQRK